MMEKQNSPKAEILLGQRDKHSDSDTRGRFFENNTWENVYTLVVDGKFNSGQKYLVNNGDGFDNSGLDEVATKYATQLKNCGISDYTLVNGERIRFSNKERIGVSSMSQEDFYRFKETLDKKLSE